MVSNAAGGTVVYKATLQDGRHVAIKSFDSDEAAFRAELAVLSGLRHQHIVRLLCWWEGDSKRLIVYEYVGNDTMVDILCEPDKELVPRVVESLRLLEDDALGGGGSRGSGRVKFSNMRLTWRSRDFYTRGGEEAELLSGGDLSALQALAVGELAGRLS